jgi:hypothetical protein
MKNFNSRTLAVLIFAAFALLSTAATAQEAKQEKPAAPPPITIAQLAGPWQIAIVGNTGCGVNSMLFNGKLSTTGVATGTLVGSSAGCGSSTTTETFTIISLKPNGSGTAGLTCGSGCGWVFNIQVMKSLQLFNLVDVSDGGSNVLAGTAIHQ